MSSNHKQVIAEIDEDLQQWAVQALNVTQLKALNYVRGDGDNTQRGAAIRTSQRTGQSYYWYSSTLPRRQAHPGMWADVTGQTANLYGKEDPEIEKNRIVGSIFNTAEHADDLEGLPRKEGGVYWVLGGLLPNSKYESDFNISLVFQRQFNALVDRDD